MLSTEYTLKYDGGKSMEDLDKASTKTLCPSSQSDSEGGKVFGVMGGMGEDPKVSYLKEAQSSVE
jgi:hypothetical protein